MSAHFEQLLFRLCCSTTPPYVPLFRLIRREDELIYILLCFKQSTWCSCKPIKEHAESKIPTTIPLQGFPTKTLQLINSGNWQLVSVDDAPLAFTVRKRHVPTPCPNSTNRPILTTIACFIFLHSCAKVP